MRAESGIILRGAVAGVLLAVAASGGSVANETCFEGICGADASGGGDVGALLQTKAASPRAPEVEQAPTSWQRVGGDGPGGSPSREQLEAARAAADAAPPQELRALPELRSPVTLTMTAVKLPLPYIGGYVYTRAYGDIPGPTIRVKPGETLKITLKNDLGPGPGYDACDMDHMNLGYFMNPDVICALNHTNLHTHGLHVSPEGRADSVFRHVRPGKSDKITLPIPKNHMAGTHLYHPHFHHSTAAQAGGGAHGALIVDDPPGSLPKYLEEMEEKTLVLSLANPAKVMRFEAWGHATLKKGTMWTQHLWKNPVYPGWEWDAVTGTLNEHGSAVSDSLGIDPHVYVNGQYIPKVTLKEDRWYRFRFILAAIEMRVELKQDEASPDQATCEYELLAKDGIYLHEAPRRITAISLVSGSRADVAIRCSCGFLDYNGCKTAMNFTALWQPMGVGGMAPTIEQTTYKMMHIVTVPSRGKDKPLEKFSVRRPCYLVDLRDAKVSRRNRHTFEMPMMYPMILKADGKGSLWGHEMPDSLLKINVGEVQQWVIKGVKYHPFHLHVNPYQIVSIWDDGYYQPGDWHDTMMPTSMNFATVRVNVDTFTGKMIAHCHLLEHEENGMMGWIDVQGREGTTWQGAKELDSECYEGRFPGAPGPKPPLLWR